jgi:hemoglobin
MTRRALPVLVLAAGCLLSFAGAAVAGSKPAATVQKSLYERLGGYDAIAAVTDDFLGRLVGDPIFAKFFVGQSTDSRGKIRQHVIELVCNATGGPCVYMGRDMKTSHTGLGITKAEWDLNVKHFLATLDKFKVMGKDRDELVGAVAGLEKDIVAQ